MAKVPEMLREGARVFEERHAQYGDNYKQFGLVWDGLFPTGMNVPMEDISYFNRLGILVQIVSKLTRYAANFNRGGHDDSLLDLSVYATMLRELDQEVDLKLATAPAAPPDVPDDLQVQIHTLVKGHGL